MISKEDLIQIATSIARANGLDPALVCSICAHESAGWKQYATRYESGFYSRYIEPMKDVRTFGNSISQSTERRDRATSFGLMQVMGQVAREYGCEVEFLSELLDPTIGITFGCRRLKRALDKHMGDVHAALLDYNGGGNAAYPDLVLAHYKDYAYLNSGS